MRRYLIVDDNPAFAENLAEILRDSGAEAVVEGHGPAALERAAREQFDALITDMRMPVMGGARLVHELRARDPGLPAVVITAYSQEDDLAAAREEGLLAALPKPVPIPRLLELLSAAKRDGLVAVIEDDPALCDNLCEALRDRGYSAVTAKTVADTDKLGAVRPFAAVADLRLPGGPDGAALKKLLARFPRLPVLVISGVSNAHQLAEGSPLFTKPFDTHKLVEALSALYRPPAAPGWSSRR
jgi:two-component system, response regulator PdtaR